MADVVTTIGLKDGEFTGGLSRLEAFVNNFKRRMESSPVNVPVGASGRPQDNALFWSDAQLRANARQINWSRRGDAAGAIGSELSGLYSAGSSMAMMVSEGARYIDQLEFMSKQHTRWKKELDSIATSYTNVINQQRAAADPIRGKSSQIAFGGFSAANSASDWGIAKMEELGTLSARLNTPVNEWWRSYEIAMDSQRVANRIASVTSRQALEQRFKDQLEARQAEESDAMQALRDRIEAGAAVNDAVFKRFDETHRETQAKDDAEQRLNFENMINEAQIKRLNGNEKEARLLEARVQYESKLAELAANDKVSQTDKDRNIDTLGRLYGLTRTSIEEAFQGKQTATYRAFDFSQGGGAIAMQAALSGGGGPMQKLIDKTSEGVDLQRSELAAIRQLKDLNQAVYQ